MVALLLLLLVGLEASWRLPWLLLLGRWAGQTLLPPSSLLLLLALGCAAARGLRRVGHERLRSAAAVGLGLAAGAGAYLAAGRILHLAEMDVLTSLARSRQRAG
jgi:hypothetical protein